MVNHLGQLLKNTGFMYNILNNAFAPPNAMSALQSSLALAFHQFWHFVQETMPKHAMYMKKLECNAVHENCMHKQSEKTLSLTASLNESAQHHIFILVFSEACRNAVWRPQHCIRVCRKLGEGTSWPSTWPPSSRGPMWTKALLDRPSTDLAAVGLRTSPADVDQKLATALLIFVTQAALDAALALTPPRLPLQLCRPRASRRLLRWLPRLPLLC